MDNAPHGLEDFPSIHNEPKSSPAKIGKLWKHSGNVFAVLFGLVMPWGLVLMSLFFGAPHVDSRWQSGRWDVYASLLLEYPAICVAFWIFPPPMIALGLACFKNEALRFFAVRAGLYWGLVVSILYLVCCVFATEAGVLVAGVIATPILFGLVMLGVWIFRRIIRILVAMTGIALVGAISPEVLYLPLGLTIVGTPACCVVVYTYWSSGVFSDNRPSPPPYQPLLSLLGGGLVVGGSTYLSFRWMLHEYSKLPTAPPDNCYLCSAAAHGSPWLVRSESVAYGAGTFRVNDQLRYLKFLELVVIAYLPHAHALVRRVYDRIGPPLSRVCRRNRWFANATFLVLQPFVLAAHAARIGLRVPLRQVLSIYRGN